MAPPGSMISHSKVTTRAVHEDSSMKAKPLSIVSARTMFPNRCCAHTIRSSEQLTMEISGLTPLILLRAENAFL